MSVTEPRRTDEQILDAVLALAANLDLADVLQSFVETCSRLTGAPYAAINVTDKNDQSTTFVRSR